MITVPIGGQEIVVKPKRLIDYVEKLDFIKSRRTTPYDLVRDFPKEDGPNAAKGSLALVEIAMRTVYTQSSSVSFEEEMSFDRSEEGFYWELWKCLPSVPPKKFRNNFIPETWRQGINRAKQVWDSGTSEEKTSLRIALEAVDESLNLGNSDGPSDTSQSPGQVDNPTEPPPLS